MQLLVTYYFRVYLNDIFFSYIIYIRIIIKALLSVPTLMNLKILSDIHNVILYEYIYVIM